MASRSWLFMVMLTPYAGMTRIRSEGLRLCRTLSALSAPLSECSFVRMFSFTTIA
ncbi:hypothetical protein GCM10010390_14270 [Streptomyces mordarskii]|uniref:Uncharacterized protein n=1 Tax=Streptomyces mordarskii TaxID=1226758 RepID=A0ABN1C6U2_9ACTN